MAMDTLEDLPWPVVGVDVTDYSKRTDGIAFDLAATRVQESLQFSGNVSIVIDKNCFSFFYKKGKWMFWRTNTLDRDVVAVAMQRAMMSTSVFYAYIEIERSFLQAHKNNVQYQVLYVEISEVPDYLLMDGIRPDVKVTDDRRRDWVDSWVMRF